jgi:hypothetical protein
VVLQLSGWAWCYKLVTVKNKLVTKCHKEPRTWTDSLDKRPTLRKMDMRFGTWNVRTLYRAGSRMTVAKEIPKETVHQLLIDFEKAYGSVRR